MKRHLIRALDKVGVAGLVAVASWLRRPRPNYAAPNLRWAAIKLAGMGDAMLMLPALEAMRQARVPALYVITTPRCRAVFEASGLADRVLVIGGRFPWSGLGGVWRRLRHVDAILDFEQHVFWSSLLVAVSRRSAQSYGFRSPSGIRNFAYDALVEPGSQPLHMKLSFDALARRAGFIPGANLVPLRVRAAAQQRALEWLQSHRLLPGRYVLLTPGSSPSAAFRRLAPERWAEIIRALPPATGAVLAGTLAERALLERIAQAADRPVPMAIDFPLERLAALMVGAQTVIATDSGPMHVAAGMGCEVVGIFGPDTPKRDAPYNSRSVSATLNLPCSPCNNAWIYREARCTNPDRYACIRRMTAQDVLVTIPHRFRMTGGREAYLGAGPPAAGA